MTLLKASIWGAPAFTQRRETLAISGWMAKSQIAYLKNRLSQKQYKQVGGCPYERIR
jgi:hypothetical protein